MGKGIPYPGIGPGSCLTRAFSEGPTDDMRAAGWSDCQRALSLSSHALTEHPRRTLEFPLGAVCSLLAALQMARWFTPLSSKAATVDSV